MTIEDLLAQVLPLPRQERARVAEQLLSSLEEPEEQVAVAWACELERRSREIAEGKVQAIEWETVRAEVLKELEQRRAGRASS
jgi:putative addiction module component (TIGR02574 family)